MSTAEEWPEGEVDYAAISRARAARKLAEDLGDQSFARYGFVHLQPLKDELAALVPDAVPHTDLCTHGRFAPLLRLQTVLSDPRLDESALPALAPLRAAVASLLAYPPSARRHLPPHGVPGGGA